MAIKDFEMNIKNADGSYDILHPITKAKNVMALDGQTAEDKLKVESGSNINGSYVKYADGIMICWTRSFLLDFENARNMNKKWTFPAEFSEQPCIQVTSHISNDSARGHHGIVLVGLTPRDAGVYAYGPYNSNIFNEKYRSVSTLAIGRWK